MSGKLTPREIKMKLLEDFVDFHPESYNMAAPQLDLVEAMAEALAMTAAYPDRCLEDTLKICQWFAGRAAFANKMINPNNKWSNKRGR